MGPSLTEPRLSRYDALSSASGEAMRRREFIKLLGGAAAAWPFSVRAQQSAMPVIGFMSPAPPRYWASIAGVSQRSGRGRLFRRPKRDDRISLGSRRLRPAASARCRICAAARECTRGDWRRASALAAKQATSTIPIVFVTGDPVKAGLVERLNRPGGNATGSYIVTTEMEQKRLSLLHELMPGVSLIGALLNPNFAVATRQLRELEEAAQTIGRRLFVAKASNDEELNAAFALLLRQGIGALLVGADAYFDTRRDRIIAFAAQNRLPAVYHFREYAFAGGLVSYGPSITDAYRRQAITLHESLRVKNLPIYQLYRPPSSILSST